MSNWENAARVYEKALYRILREVSYLDADDNSKAILAEIRTILQEVEIE